MTISFVPSRLATLDVFRDAELDELRRLAQIKPLGALLRNPAWREASAIDLAYTSALRAQSRTYVLPCFVCVPFVHCALPRFVQVTLATAF